MDGGWKLPYRSGDAPNAAARPSRRDPNRGNAAPERRQPGRTACSSGQISWRVFPSDSILNTPAVASTDARRHRGGEERSGKPDSTVRTLRHLVEENPRHRDEGDDGHRDEKQSQTIENRVRIEHQDRQPKEDKCHRSQHHHRPAARASRAYAMRSCRFIGAFYATSACRCQAAIVPPCSTADLMSIRSCRRAFFATPLNRRLIGIDINFAPTLWGWES
jgi:hypothetical protein